MDVFPVFLCVDFNPSSDILYNCGRPEIVVGKTNNFLKAAVTDDALKLSTTHLSLNNATSNFLGISF